MVDLRLPKVRKLVNNAPVWKRFAAFIADLLIIQFIIVGPFSGAIQSKLPLTSDVIENYNFLLSNESLIQSLYPIFIAIFILIYLYFVAFEFIMRQTPGKIILNIYVVAADKKDELNLVKVLIRNLALIPILPFTLLWIVDPIYLVITGKRLSDIFARTQVVEEIFI